MHLLLAGVALLLVTAFGALVLARRPFLSTLLAASGAVLGCALGLVPAVRELAGAAPERFLAQWDAAHGPFSVALDPLSAFFLVPVLALSALGAVYGAGYLYAYRDRKPLGVPWFFYNVFVAGMTLVTLARTPLLFLVAWELMSIAAYFLVTFEDERADVRRAGWIYLIATHCGVAFLFLALLLLERGGAAPGLVFALALVGFGAKAGLVPFHVWLPEAHPAAPSHVSAVMSGAMIKMGLYGLLRVLAQLGEPAPWWGATLCVLGLVTAVAGIGLAPTQRDIKRMLAYSSIENMGLVALALGLALLGRAGDHPVVAALGLSAALLHVWSHALMKGLMFFGAGSVLHGTGTRDVEELGGLMKRMPWTATLMVFGAVAMAALPSMNGFASKWLLYLGLLEGVLSARGSHGLPGLFAIATLALVGGLSAVTYVRLVGVALLGEPRSRAAEHAHESSPWLLAPMLALLAGCVVLAIVPGPTLTALSGVFEPALGPAGVAALRSLDAEEAPLSALGRLNAGLLVLAVGGTLAFQRLVRRAPVADAGTWGCGYVRPTARMQYTGLSFAQILCELILPGAMRPRATPVAVKGLFPVASDFSARAADPLLERAYEPLFVRCGHWFSRLRILQQGKTHVYLLYIAAMVVLALTWVSVRAGWAQP